jgi:acyl transferase domain-containing protein/acyl-coenzyme A synthetase/AMP-(fatty) acid ligase/acyl carrier protein
MTAATALLGEAIEAAARRDPDRVALVDEGSARTYGQLAMLLDGSQAPSRREAVAVGPAVADVEALLRRSFRGESLLLLARNVRAEELERAEALFAAPEFAAGGEVQAVGLATSGSGGLPKVVELDWESLLANASSFAAAAGYGPADTIWCTTPLAHLFCLGTGVLAGLLSGATVRLGAGMMEASEFAAAARGSGATALLSVPFLFRRYLAAFEQDPALARDWGVRTCIAAGEPVAPDLVEDWRRLAGVPLRAHYGLTEGGHVTLADGAAGEGVGAPLDDVEVAVGEGGEIRLRRRPPQRPYRIAGQEEDPEGWCETGDLGHLDADGNLHVSGRAGRRIDFAGKKVDPEEVEQALLACAGVADCAVAGVAGEGGERIAAFLEVEAGASVSDGEIRAELATRLSPHKLPRHFARVERVPRTLTGKVRRGELIASLEAAPAAEAGGDLLELVRREAAATVLGHASAAAIDPAASFKELGFDSLAALELRNRLAAATGLRLPSTVAFDHPTPALLAQFLRDPAARAGAEPVPLLGAAASGEPIAIVGLGCRYPGGADSPEELWRLLERGGEAVGPFPEDRGWDLEALFDPDPDHPGTSYCDRGGFLERAAEFDAGFFGIGPREARAMDPQQRLLLELAWETFEAAGLEPAALAGTETGAFVGVMHNDYALAGSEQPDAEGYQGVGTAASVLSGRLAYAFGLEGPALSVDTACSSSLVAMHLAAAALRAGECELALAGGASIRSTPVQFVEFSRQRGLARDGRCKPFDAAADGTGFSEGAGLVLLERLSDAERNGHQVLALIRGSAVNQDGASNGLTAPNGPAQERVIRQALANAGLEPAEVDAVEAHGTGTALGDPIEAGAILATYGKGRESPLLLGSVKSNLGHTMAAAGVAGVIKMVEALRHERLPRTIHLTEPTPHVDWEAGAVELLHTEREWRSNGHPRRAGVSSFGISGTNAHLVLEEPPATAAAPEPPEPPLSPLLLSAKDEGALRESAERLAGHLRAHPEQGLAAVGATLAATRSRLPRRAAVLGGDREEAIAALEALGTGAPHRALLEGHARGGRVCFLFPGQGSQWRGMGAELLERSAVFRERIEACEAALEPHASCSVRDVLEGRGYSEAVEVIQPALFAVMVSLAELWRASGVEPDVVLGHSQGEIAAACVAGALSLEDAAKVVALRSRALASELAGRGGMASVQLPATRVEELIGLWRGQVAIAAENSPHSTVVSGSPEALAELLARCASEEIRARQIAVDYASHSPQVEPLREHLLAELASISPRPSKVPVYSAISARPIAGEEMGPEYWYRSMREPVRFYPAVSRLLADGFTAFVEASPHPVLVPAVAECAAAEDREPAAIATLRREEGGEERFAAALAEAHLAGAESDWERFFGPRSKVPLPTYPFQRSRYWLEGRGPGAADPAAIGQADPDHPFLASLLTLPNEEGWLATGQISTAAHPWLADHMVLGAAILPGTAFVELGLKAAEIAGARCLAELAIEAPLLVPEKGSVSLQVRIGPASERGERSLEIHSRPGADPGAEWTRHASGSLSDRAPSAPEPAGAWLPPGAEELDLSDFYERASELGIDYGPAFQGLKAAWRRGAELFAEVELDAEQEAEAGRFGVHPALLDAAVHLDLLNQEPAAAPRIPFACSDISLVAAGHSSLRSQIAPAGGDAVRLVVTAADGAPVARIESLAIRRIDPAALRSGGEDLSGALHQVSWRELDLPEAAAAAVEARLLRLAADPDLDPPAAARELCERVLATAREALAEERGGPVAFHTEGAVAAAEGEVPDPALAAAWGLVRSAQAEHPGRFLLIDSDGSESSEAALAAALGLEEEPEIALRNGAATASRLSPLAERELAPAAPLDPEGTVVITGGTGAVGAHLARHLAATHGARHLLLTSRRGAEAPGAQELIAELAELGAEAEVRACDVSDRSQLEGLLASLPADRPLAAVLHCAAVFDNGLVEFLDPERMQNAFAPKATAAWHLHELTREIPGCELVLFSSIAGTLQSPGQGNYAAANAFLDALAQRRAAEGLAGVAIGWGLWAAERVDDDGLAATDLARLRRIGIVGMQTDRALALFDLGRAAPAPSFLATPINRAALRSLGRAGTAPALLRGLAPAAPGLRRHGETLAARLPKLTEAERVPAALDLVRAHTAEVLGHSAPELVDPRTPFQEIGFDSLAAVDLRSRLARGAGLRLPATLVFDHPTPEAVAAYLVAELGGAPAVPGTDRKLDEIAAILSSIEEGERARAAARLRPLFADLLGSGEEEDAVDFEAASDEELLRLIDRELGPC